MEQSDLQFKDGLRKERIMYENYLELLKKGDLEELKKRFETELERINLSLQD